MLELREQAPYYLQLGEQDLQNFLAAAGIREKDDVLLFSQICRYAREKEVIKIDLDEFALEVVHWAELNNIVRLRHLQNVQRLLGQLLPRLKEKDFCEIREKDGEISAIILKEPGSTKQIELLKQFVESAANPFPTRQDLPFPMPDSYFFEIKIQELTQAKINEAIEAGRPVRISFGEVEGDIFFPVGMLTELSRLARLKIRAILMPGNQRTKLLEDLVRDLKAVMPEKVISAERVIHVLEGRENEVPLYLLNLSNRFVSYMQQEKELKYKLTAIQAGKILLQLKLDEEERKKSELEALEREQDRHRALMILRDVKKPLSRSEILSPELEKSLWEPLTNRYHGASLRLLLSELLDEASRLVLKEDSQKDKDILPPLVKFKAKHEEYYIHRDSLIPSLLSMREKIHQELTYYYVSNWAELIRSGIYENAMESDAYFAKDVEKKVRQRYGEFDLMLSQPQLVMNAIFYSPYSEKERSEILLDFFTRPPEPIFKAYHNILKLNRQELYRQAKATLPIIYRIFLFRLILWFLELFRSKKKSHNEREQKSRESHEEREDESQSSEPNFLPSEIEQLKNHYLGSADFHKELKKLEEAWNIKIGPVREVLLEKVQREVHERTKRLYQFLKKSPRYSVKNLQEELENMATDMVRKAGNDVPDKGAYRKYVVLLALDKLKDL
ncbi:MAG: hypothetical protein NZM25_02400 [Leptospiraceae bacterium]|nr:hypothetical protein [Leptospiraceae bacterium]MDW8307679.1 hypothetical protein [Leptospiraceae bacterium]